ncbi:MAG: alcohol dehydrogenase catalytic domain-containing protein, partial [Burkholderiales bacterium]
MRASVIAAPRTSRLKQVETPRPGPGQVLIELEGSGVCASSIPVWEGRSWFDYPQPAGAPGHEGWGRVAAVGEGVADLREGIRVAALTYRAHAEYDLADANAIVPLPDVLTD